MAELKVVILTIPCHHHQFYYRVDSEINDQNDLISRYTLAKIKLKGGKPENVKKKPRSTEENQHNSTHTIPKLGQALAHLSTNPV